MWTGGWTDDIPTRVDFVGELYHSPFLNQTTQYERRYFPVLWQTTDNQEIEIVSKKTDRQSQQKSVTDF